MKSLLDAVMERRARELMEQVGAWLPAEGPVLDLGSGTGHLSARLIGSRGYCRHRNGAKIDQASARAQANLY